MSEAAAPGLTPEEVAAGFVRRLRTRVEHNVAGCGRVSAMKPQQAEDMARDPRSWHDAWCMVCGRRLPVNQFIWTPGGEPVGT